MALDYIGEAGQIKRKAYQRRLPENPSLDYYYIIRDTGNAESILIEYGFIDNKNDANKLEIDLDPAKIREDYKKDYDNIYGDDSLNRVQKSLALKELLHMSICQVVNDLDLFFTRPFDLTPEEHAEKNKQEQKALEQELQMS